MRLLINVCEWQQQLYQLIFVKLAMTNINAANHVSTQSYEYFDIQFFSIDNIIVRQQ